MRTLFAAITLAAAGLVAAPQAEAGCNSGIGGGFGGGYYGGGYGYHPVGYVPVRPVALPYAPSHHHHYYGRRGGFDRGFNPYGPAGFGRRGFNDGGLSVYGRRGGFNIRF